MLSLKNLEQLGSGYRDIDKDRELMAEKLSDISEMYSSLSVSLSDLEKSKKELEVNISGLLLTTRRRLELDKKINNEMISELKLSARAITDSLSEKSKTLSGEINEQERKLAKLKADTAFRDSEVRRSNASILLFNGIIEELKYRKASMEKEISDLKKEAESFEKEKKDIKALSDKLEKRAEYLERRETDIVNLAAETQEKYQLLMKKICQGHQEMSS